MATLEIKKETIKINQQEIVKYYITGYASRYNTLYELMQAVFLRIKTVRGFTTHGELYNLVFGVNANEIIQTFGLNSSGTSFSISDYEFQTFVGLCLNGIPLITKTDEKLRDITL